MRPYEKASVLAFKIIETRKSTLLNPRQKSLKVSKLEADFESVCRDLDEEEKEVIRSAIMRTLLRSREEKRDDITYTLLATSLGLLMLLTIVSLTFLF